MPEISVGSPKELQRGYLLHYKHRVFSKNWKEVFGVLYDDSTFQWYSDESQAELKGSLNLKCLAPWIVVGKHTERLQHKPRLPSGKCWMQEHQIAVGSGTDEPIEWFLCDSEEDFINWWSFIVYTLPPPPQHTPRTPPSTPANEPAEQFESGSAKRNSPVGDELVLNRRCSCDGWGTGVGFLAGGVIAGSAIHGLLHHRHEQDERERAEEASLRQDDEAQHVLFGDEREKELFGESCSPEFKNFGALDDNEDGQEDDGKLAADEGVFGLSDVTEDPAAEFPNRFHSKPLENVFGPAEGDSRLEGDNY